jgi:hypothetical protein
VNALITRLRVQRWPRNIFPSHSYIFALHSRPDAPFPIKVAARVLREIPPWRFTLLLSPPVRAMKARALSPRDRGRLKQTTLIWKIRSYLCSADLSPLLRAWDNLHDLHPSTYTQLIPQSVPYTTFPLYPNPAHIFAIHTLVIAPLQTLAHPYSTRQSRTLSGLSITETSVPRKHFSS